MNKSLVVGPLTLDPPLMLAPMAGITDLSLRRLAREEGAPFCFTEMISAQGLVRDGKNTLPLLKSCPDDRPLGIQIFGDDPVVMAEAARKVQEGCDLIDINMGCPVRKVVSGGAGSALMRDPVKVAGILSAVRRAVTVPLTIKIRAGWSATETTFKEVASVAESEGCDAIALHPRTRTQMFTDHADWSLISQLKASVKIPVIGSGDIQTWSDISDIFAETGCDGVMVARGVMGNPWIFSQYISSLAGMLPSGPTLEEKQRVILRHLSYLSELYGNSVAVKEMRKHLSWYVKGISGASRFRSTVNGITEFSDLVAHINDFFSRASSEKF